VLAHPCSFLSCMLRCFWFSLWDLCSVSFGYRLGVVLASMGHPFFACTSREECCRAYARMHSSQSTILGYFMLALRHGTLSAEHRSNPRKRLMEVCVCALRQQFPAPFRQCFPLQPLVLWATLLWKVVCVPPCHSMQACSPHVDRHVRSHSLRLQDGGLIFLNAQCMLQNSHAILATIDCTCIYSETNPSSLQHKS